MANDKDFILKNPVEVGGPTNVTLGSITGNAINLSTGNYFKDTLAANTTYTISNAGDVQSFQVEVTGGLNSYDISNANYDNTSFLVSVAGESQPYSVSLNPDGTKMFAMGHHLDRVIEFALSTAFNVSTASEIATFTGIGSQDNQPLSLEFKPDGTAMYMLGAQNSTVYQYSLSTAYDVSTASYASKSFSVGTQTTDGRSLNFKPDGTKMYVTERANDTILQYSLSTAWDVSTASYDSVSFSIASQVGNPYGTIFNQDGTELFVANYTDNTVYKYTLSTAYDISTTSYSSVSFDLSSQTTTPTDIFFGNNGQKMYINSAGDDTIYQYTTGSDATLTWPSSIEFAGGVAPAAPANGETDIFTFSTDDGGTSYIGTKTADNLS
jgi:DNA-binding beta-propeller fold protein YncE